MLVFQQLTNSLSIGEGFFVETPKTLLKSLTWLTTFTCFTHDVTPWL